MDETTKIFVWVLQKLIEAMVGRVPRYMMTDQDKAMTATIEIVFPDAIHQRCKWHMLSKTKEKLGWLISDDNEFAQEYDYYVNRTETPKEFEMMWERIEDKYHLQVNKFSQSISATRRMWAPDLLQKMLLSIYRHYRNVKEHERIIEEECCSLLHNMIT